MNIVLTKILLAAVSLGIAIAIAFWLAQGRAPVVVKCAPVRVLNMGMALEGPVIRLLLTDSIHIGVPDSFPVFPEMVVCARPQLP